MRSGTEASSVVTSTSPPVPTPAVDRERPIADVPASTRRCRSRSGLGRPATKSNRRRRRHDRFAHECEAPGPRPLGPHAPAHAASARQKGKSWVGVKKGGGAGHQPYRRGGASAGRVCAPWSRVRAAAGISKKAPRRARERRRGLGPRPQVAVVRTERPRLAVIACFSVDRGASTATGTTRGFPNVQSLPIGVVARLRSGRRRKRRVAVCRIDERRHDLRAAGSGVRAGRPARPLRRRGARRRHRRRHSGRSDERRRSLRAACSPSHCEVSIPEGSSPVEAQSPPPLAHPRVVNALFLRRVDRYTRDSAVVPQTPAWASVAVSYRRRGRCGNCRPCRLSSCSTSAR